MAGSLFLCERATPSLTLELKQGHDVVTPEQFPTVEERQLNERANADDVASDRPDQLRRRPYRPGRQRP